MRTLQDLVARGWRDSAACVRARARSQVREDPFEAEPWNSDKWACVVSCGETWTSPVWLRPSGLLRHRCGCF